MKRLRFFRMERLLAVPLALSLTFQPAVYSSDIGRINTSERQVFDRQAMASRALFSGLRLGDVLPVKKLLATAALAAMAVPRSFSASIGEIGRRMQDIGHAVGPSIEVVRPVHEAFKSGWSVWRYAQANGTSMEMVATWNPWIKTINPRAIPIGHDVIIPKLHAVAVPVIPRFVPHLPAIEPLGWHGFWFHAGQHVLAFIQLYPLEMIGGLILAVGVGAIYKGWGKQHQRYRAWILSVVAALFLVAPSILHPPQRPVMSEHALTAKPSVQRQVSVTVAETQQSSDLKIDKKSSRKFSPSGDRDEKKNPVEPPDLSVNDQAFGNALNDVAPSSERPMPPMEAIPGPRDPAKAEKLLQLAQAAVNTSLKKSDLENRYSEATLDRDHRALKPTLRVGAFFRVEPGVLQAGPEVQFQTSMPGSPRAVDLSRRKSFQTELSRENRDGATAKTSIEWMNAYLELVEAHRNEVDINRLIQNPPLLDPSATSLLDSEISTAKAQEMAAVSRLLKASGIASVGIDPKDVLEWSENTDPQQFISLLQPYVQQGPSDAEASATRLRSVVVDIQGRSQERLSPFWRHLKIGARFPAPWWGILQLGGMRGPIVDWEQLSALCRSARQAWLVDRYHAYETAATGVVERQESLRSADMLKSRVDEVLREAKGPILSLFDRERLWSAAADLTLLANQAQTQASKIEFSLSLWSIPLGSSSDDIERVIEKRYASDVKDLQDSSRAWRAILEKKKPRESGILIEALKELEHVGDAPINDSDVERGPEAASSARAGSVDSAPRATVEGMAILAGQVLGNPSQAPDSLVMNGGPVTTTAGVRLTAPYAKRSVKELTSELKTWRSLEEENDAKISLRTQRLNARTDAVQINDLDAIIAALTSELFGDISPARRAECEGLLASRETERAVRQARIDHTLHSTDFMPDADYAAALAHYQAALVSAEIRRRSVNAWTVTGMAQTAGLRRPSSYAMIAFDPGTAVTTLVDRVIHRKPKKVDLYLAQSAVELARLDVSEMFYSLLQKWNSAHAGHEQNQKLMARLQMEIEQATESGETARMKRAVTELAEAGRSDHEVSLEEHAAADELLPFKTLIHRDSLSGPMKQLRDVLKRIDDNAFDRGSPPSVMKAVAEASLQTGVGALFPTADFSASLFGSAMNAMSGHSFDAGLFATYDWSPGQRQKDVDRARATAADDSVLAFEKILDLKKQQKEFEIHAAVEKGLSVVLEDPSTSAHWSAEGKARAQILAQRAREKAAQAASQLGVSLETVRPLTTLDPIVVPHLDDPAGAAERVSGRCTCGYFEGTRDPSTVGRRRFEVAPFAGKSGGGFGFSFWDRYLWNDPVRSEHVIWDARERLRQWNSKLNTAVMKTRLLVQNDAVQSDGLAWEAALDALDHIDPDDFNDRLTAYEDVYRNLEALLIEINARQIPDLSTLDSTQWEDNGISMRTAARGYFRKAAQEPRQSLHRSFSAHGIIKSVDVSGEKLTIAHGPIPGFMEMGMTMTFSVEGRLKGILDRLQSGQAIDFTLEVLSDQVHITAIASSESTVEPSVIAPKTMWTLETPEGKTIHGDDLQGKILFINRWATWCVPCRAEMESILRLRDRFKDRTGIAFLLVTDEDPKTVNEFLKDHRDYRDIYLMRGKSETLFDAPRIPTTLMISKSGEVLSRIEGAKAWDSSRFVRQINKLLEKSNSLERPHRQNRLKQAA